MENLIAPEPEDKEAFRQKLKALNLDPIVWQLLHGSTGKRWSFERSLVAIAAYKKFLLSYYLHPNQNLAPTNEVDRVWHCHILDTEKYINDCLWLFGYIVHHYPYPTDDAA